ncbi:RHS repeat-associated core domain-containing protein [Cysteiniphilum litorale]|uniref:RHS repeat-associated core domain-containing protein n=1 Tax=Cysteiniphilum litorale TaxID=2056700 RepID=UPI003F88152E
MKRIICLLSAVLSITHSVAAPYHYDANGNMTEDNMGNLYIYSANNQLVGVQNVNHKLNDNNHYNAAGFRDARNMDGHTVGLIYKDGQLINELNNKLKSSYLEHDVRYVELSSERHQYLMSANNNSTSLLLADNSSIESSYNYNAYGASVRYADNSPKMFGINTNLITHNPLTYDGEYQDHDSGLIYLRARFYNPKTMRFMQRDSYNLLNRYAFANSNPVNNIDPNGHFAFSIPGLFLGAATLAPIGDLAYQVYELATKQARIGDPWVYGSMIADGLGLIGSLYTDYRVIKAVGELRYLQQESEENLYDNIRQVDINNYSGVNKTSTILASDRDNLIRNDPKQVINDRYRISGYNTLFDDVGKEYHNNNVLHQGIANTAYNRMNKEELKDKDLFAIGTGDDEWLPGKERNSIVYKKPVKLSSSKTMSNTTYQFEANIKLIRYDEHFQRAEAEVEYTLTKI